MLAALSAYIISPSYLVIISAFQITKSLVLKTYSYVSIQEIVQQLQIARATNNSSHFSTLRLSFHTNKLGIFKIYLSK